jgi:hypothetical protein
MDFNHRISNMNPCCFTTNDVAVTLDRVDDNIKRTILKQVDEFAIIDSGGSIGLGFSEYLLDLYHSSLGPKRSAYATDLNNEKKVEML